MKKHPIQAQANVHEFTQDELSFLIHGMRAVDIEPDESLLVHMDLLERLELELLHRFGMFIEDPAEEDGKKEAWAEREMAKLDAARKDEGANP